jgi:pimeloyl-ACP methyl ester carboxylesterase
VVVAATDGLRLANVSLEMFSRGDGPPLLFLHAETGLDFSAPWVDALAETYRVIAPSHPGFGRSELPRWMSSVDDLAYTYLDLLDALDLRDVTLVGVGFGGWIAAEVAVRNTSRIGRLVLADTLGIKLGDRLTRDIVDIFVTKQSDLAQLSYHDPSRGEVQAAGMSDDDARILFRNREAVALFGWSPYMHNPKLKYQLHRIDVPTLVLWGESDRIVTESYGRAFAGAIPDSVFETIPAAGHFPHVEQPDVFAQRIRAFADAPTRAKGSLS